MPQYAVAVTHRMEFCTTITVEARNANAAEEKVMAMFEDTPPVTFTMTDTHHNWEVVDEETVYGPTSEAA